MPTLKKSSALVAGAVALALALSGCNAAAAGGPVSGGPSLVLVTPGPIGANEFLMGAEKGITDAADASGGSARVFQSRDVSQIGTQLDAAVAAQPDVIVAVGFDFADAISAVAPQHPDQQFLFVDACTETPITNVTCAVFREHEAVFLAGYEAGMLSKTGQVGAVVALDTPQIRRYSDPFGAGALLADPANRFGALFVGGSNPFNDPGRAKEQALSLADGGADVLISAAAGGNAGVFDAARTAGILAFGVDVNQCSQAPGTIVDNVLKQVDVVVSSSVADILDGNAGGTTSYGLAEGAMSLTALQSDVADSGCVIAEHPDVIAKIQELREQIISGKIQVDDPQAA